MADAEDSLGTKALVIDDDVGVCQLICDLCDERGMEVWGASDGHLSMEIFRREWPRLVFVDLQLPDTDGLTLTRQMLALRPETAVVIITGHGTEEVAIGALRAGACNYLKKPLEIEELRRVITTELQSARASQRLTAEEISGGAQRLLMRIPNSIAVVPPVAQAIERLCPERLTADERGAVRLMVHEALLNAIEHGNLGVTLQEKAAALHEDRYEALLAERAAEPGRAHRQVVLTATITDDEIRCTVTDMGGGFDWKNQPDPRDPKNLLRENGRGLLLIQLNADEVFHGGSGNEITMVKRFTPMA